MATCVTITGTGTPIQRPDRAGAGVLVTYGDIALQFDAGRGTVMRLAGARQRLTALDALFVTHHHSDHIVGIPDLVMTRWLNDVGRTGIGPLPVYAPEGEAITILQHMLDIWQNEMIMRQTHTNRPDLAEMDVHGFRPNKERPVDVFSVDQVTVSAIGVEHEPVTPAVAYRIQTPDGVVVISGDTAVCAQVERMARGADVVVHEAIRRDGVEQVLSNPAALLAYHSECGALGAMAQRAGVRQLVLTHLVPPPDTSAAKVRFEQDVRAGGFQGELIVADDLTTIRF